MVRVDRVPVERRGTAPLRDLEADHVRAVRRLLGVHRDEVVDRRVGRDDDGVARDDAALARLDRRAASRP